MRHGHSCYWYCNLLHTPQCKVLPCKGCIDVLQSMSIHSVSSLLQLGCARLPECFRSAKGSCQKNIGKSWNGSRIRRLGLPDQVRPWPGRGKGWKTVCTLMLHHENIKGEPGKCTIGPWPGCCNPKKSSGQEEIADQLSTARANAQRWASVCWQHSGVHWGALWPRGKPSKRAAAGGQKTRCYATAGLWECHACENNAS